MKTKYDLMWQKIQIKIAEYAAEKYRPEPVDIGLLSFIIVAKGRNNDEDYLVKSNLFIEHCKSLKINPMLVLQLLRKAQNIESSKGEWEDPEKETETWGS